MEKLTWLQWQLRNKYIWISLIFIVGGIFCWNSYDYGGVKSAIGLFAVGALAIIHGVIYLWNEYKRGGTS